MRMAGRVRFKATMRLWPLGRLGKKAARLPVIGKVFGPVFWNEKNLDATYLPVGETVLREPPPRVRLHLPG